MELNLVVITAVLTHAVAVGHALMPGRIFTVGKSGQFSKEECSLSKPPWCRGVVGTRDIDIPSD